MVCAQPIAGHIYFGTGGPGPGSVDPGLREVEPPSHHPLASGKAETFMLMAHSTVLHELVSRYEALRTATEGSSAAAELKRRLEDAAYTLCVITGTRHPDQALAVARARLAATDD